MSEVWHQPLRRIAFSLLLPALAPIVSHAAIEIEAGSIDFAMVWVGQSQSVKVPIKNTAGWSLNFTVAAKGTSFTQTNDCDGFLDSGARCTTTVTFAPENAWDYPGLLTASTAGSPSQSIHLHGIGRAAVLSVEDTAVPKTILTELMFPVTVTTEKPPTKWMTVRNNGNANTTLPAGAVSVAQPFQLTTDQCSNAVLAIAGTCQLGITFAPTLEKEYRGDNYIMEITHTNGARVVLPLVGHGEVPCSISPYADVAHDDLIRSRKKQATRCFHQRPAI